tara:strand:- start:241 stop:612 length:372 start_codon:yes stop_codon:yes gene_type:complete
MENSFKQKHSFETRQAEAEKIVNKHADRVPIIVTKSSKAKSSLNDIQKNKFLVPNDLTLAQFSYIIKKRIEIQQNDALYLFVDTNGDNILATSSATVSNLYKDYKDKDGFLYLSYCGENAFGN